jgi:metallo-beta-lactamase class B
MSRPESIAAPMLALLALATAIAAAAPASSAVPPDQAPIECGSCADWNAPQAPFRLYGNSWYVGPHGLSTVLIDSGAGLILIDGALP